MESPTKKKNVDHAIHIPVDYNQKTEPPGPMFLCVIVGYRSSIMFLRCLDCENILAAIHDTEKPIENCLPQTCWPYVLHDAHESGAAKM